MGMTVFGLFGPLTTFMSERREKRRWHYLRGVPKKADIQILSATCDRGEEDKSVVSVQLGGKGCVGVGPHGVE